MIFLILLLILPLASANDITINCNDSISDTINNANPNDVIYLNPGVYNESFIHIDKDINLIGNGSTDNIIINGMRKNTIIDITDPITVRLNNITFINGYTQWGYGGAISNEHGKVYVENCNFFNNTAEEENSGAINNYGTHESRGYLYVNNCIFDNNSAGHDGGAIATYCADTEIYNSIFTNNYAWRDGGAIRCGVYGKTLVQNCTLRNNEAKEWGGALYNWPGELTAINCLIDNNTAGTKAAAFVTSGPSYLYNNTFINNKGEKGLIYINQETKNYPSTVIAHGNIFANNTIENGFIVHIEETTSKYTDFNDNYWGSDNPDWSKIWNDETNSINIPVKYLTLDKILPEKETDHKSEDIPKEETDINKKPIDTNPTNKTNNVVNTNSSVLINSKISSQGIILNNNTDTKSESPEPGKDSTINREKKATEINKKQKTTKELEYNYMIPIVIVLILLVLGFYKYRKND